MGAWALIFLVALSQSGPRGDEKSQR